MELARHKCLAVAGQNIPLRDRQRIVSQASDYVAEALPERQRLPCRKSVKQRG